MDLKRRIYFSFLGRLISIVQNTYGRLVRPYMIYGFKSKFDGKFYKLVRVSSTALIVEPEKLQIEDNIWIWHHSIIDASNKVIIRKGCQIGAWVGIFSHSSHVAIRLYGENYITTAKEDRVGYVRKPVEIGEYCFIGARALVMPGVTIGKGSLIGAGAIVSKSVPEFSIVIGEGEIKGSTLNLDKKFFTDKLVQENYFDRKVIEDFLKNKL
jgi:acetyltransferase-like isoleucine patch superfamily enzyme